MDNLGINERTYFSSKKFQGETGLPGYPRYGKGSGILDYLEKICFDNPREEKTKLPNFFDEEGVAIRIKFFRLILGKALLVGEKGPFKYKEYVRIRWQPQNKEPVNLIKKLKEFGFKKSS